MLRLRLNRDLAEQGLLISPAINSRAAFAALALGGNAGPHPTTSLQLEAGEPEGWLFGPESARRYFEPLIEIAFHRLTIPPAAPPEDASLAALSGVLALSRNAPGGMLIDLPDGRPALDFNQDSPRRFNLPPETTHVRLSLGILAADLPVRFRAFVAADGEAPLEIWSRRIDRTGSQVAEFDAQAFAGRPGRALLIAAAPEKSVPMEQNFAYLSGIELARQP